MVKAWGGHGLEGVNDGKKWTYEILSTIKVFKKINISGVITYKWQLQRKGKLMQCPFFQEKWTNDYFFVEVKVHSVHLVCGDMLAIMKKKKKTTCSVITAQNMLIAMNWETKCLSIESMFSSDVRNHNKLSFTWLCCERDIIQKSYVVSEQITKKVRPQVEGEFVKEVMAAAVELLAPDKLKLFQSVSLSQRTVSDRIVELAQDIEKILKDSAGDFQFFSLGCDATTDITNTAQRAIIICGITAELDAGEELPSLRAVHSTTRGEDLFERLVSSMKKFELRFKNVCDLTIDGAPAMVGLHKKELSTFVKKLVSVLIQMI